MKYLVKPGARVTLYVCGRLEVEVDDAEDAVSEAVDQIISRGEVYETRVEVEEITK